MKKVNDVKNIREHDVVPVLENALNYGHPWDTLYMACLEEITELRNQVIALGGSIPPGKHMLSGEELTRKLDFKDPRI